MRNYDGTARYNKDTTHLKVGGEYCHRDGMMWVIQGKDVGTGWEATEGEEKLISTDFPIGLFYSVIYLKKTTISRFLSQLLIKMWGKHTGGSPICKMLLNSIKLNRLFVLLKKLQNITAALIRMPPADGIRYRTTGLCLT